jgi:sarcosine oxidase, subunit alpha
MRTVDVAVIGAGPTGIAAALAAAQAGAETLLIEENATIGGQLNWRIELTREQTGGLDVSPAPGPVVAGELARSLDSTANLKVETGTVAWGLFDDNILGISTEIGADEVKATAIVLATGSTDIALPFPGWTLPGVMTDRAARIFMHIHRVLPGQSWAILGETEEADELAADLEKLGAEIVVRCDDVEQIRASGVNRLSYVEVGQDTYEVDALAIALGRQPDAELALHAKVEGAFVPEIGGYTVSRDELGQTSEPGIYIAGDAAGIGTLGEIVAEGTLVGRAAAGASKADIMQARELFASIATEGRNNAITRVRLAPAST